MGWDNTTTTLLIWPFSRVCVCVCLIFYTHWYIKVCPIIHVDGLGTIKKETHILLAKGFNLWPSKSAKILGPHIDDGFSTLIIIDYNLMGGGGALMGLFLPKSSRIFIFVFCELWILNCNCIVSVFLFSSILSGYLLRENYLLRMCELNNNDKKDKNQRNFVVNLLNFKLYMNYWYSKKLVI